MYLAKGLSRAVPAWPGRILPCMAQALQDSGGPTLSADAAAPSPSLHIPSHPALLLLWLQIGFSLRGKRVAPPPHVLTAGLRVGSGCVSLPEATALPTTSPASPIFGKDSFPCPFRDKG